MLLIEYDPDMGCLNCPLHHRVAYHDVCKRSINNDGWCDLGGDEVIGKWYRPDDTGSAPASCPLRSGGVKVMVPTADKMSADNEGQDDD